MGRKASTAYSLSCFGAVEGYWTSAKASLLTEYLFAGCRIAASSLSACAVADCAITDGSVAKCEGRA